MKSNRIREGNRGVTFVLYVLSFLILLITVYPLYYVFILSISEPKYAMSMDVYLIPKGFSLSAYEVLVGNAKMWRAYANTILYALSTTALMLITSITVAYGLNYKRLIGKKYFTMFLLIPMYFSGGMIPSFLLILKLGLYNNPLSQILPACISVWNIILVRSYFRTIPDSLSEAAKMDGAGVVQILWNIFVPLGKPIFAVIAVYTIIGVWNSWFNALLYLPREEWQPLQMYLRRVLVENTATIQSNMSMDEARAAMLKRLSNAQLKYAMIIFTSLPVLCTYPFFQKYFVKGMVLGSLKE